jgi:hypothetical protein
MNVLRKKDPIFDVVVVGAGLGGLVTAACLVQRGLDVCVLEGADFAGGHSRSIYSPLGLVDNGLKFFPDNANAQSLLMRLGLLVGQSIEIESVENGPVTFHNGEIKPFVGFGKEAPEFHRELSYFLEPRRLQLSRSLGQLTADLIALLGDRILTSSTVTKYLGREGVIESVMVNGQRQIFGREFVHSASPKLLGLLLSDEVLSSRTKQKIAKAEYWTILGLDLFHNGSISGKQELHLLNGTTQDEIGPCVGLFQGAVPSLQSKDELVQHSQWMTFVDEESSEDPEVIGAVLKKIKRQIKRAYPEALEKLISERIFVAPMMEAELDLKFDKRGALSGVSNLWLAHGTASGQPNLVGSLQQAETVVENLMRGQSEESVSASPVEEHSPLGAL